MTTTDDVIFTAVMGQTEICKQFLEAVMQKKIRNITRHQTESAIANDVGVHGVRFDVEFVGDDIIYDIEMQTSNMSTLSKRVRYYQSSLDTRYLKSGMDYADLPNTVVIFICTRDPFHEGMAMYIQQSVLRETNDVVQDGRTAIYLNTEYYRSNASDTVIDVLNYMRNPDRYYGNNSLVERMDTAVKRSKLNADVRRSYMSLQDYMKESRAEGREEGRMEGREEGMDMILGIIAAIKAGKTPDNIYEEYGIDITSDPKYAVLFGSDVQAQPTRKTPLK